MTPRNSELAVPRPKIIVPTHYHRFTSYKKAIENQGGEVRYARLSTLESNELRSIDAIMLPGGGDVDPEAYDAKRKPYCGDTNIRKDKTDIGFARLAYVHNIPILGICRGMQIMNVERGGTLYQDITEEHPLHMDVIHTHGHHKVLVEQNTMFGKFMAVKEFSANSRHHQSIKKLGTDLKIGGYANDGVIEAICAPEKDFYMGVQFHAEDMDSVFSDKLLYQFIFAANLRKFNIRR